MILPCSRLPLGRRTPCRRRSRPRRVLQSPPMLPAVLMLLALLALLSLLAFAGAGTARAEAPQSLAEESGRNDASWQTANGRGRKSGQKRCVAGYRTITVYERAYVRAPSYKILGTPARYAWRKRRALVSPPSLERRWLRAHFVWDPKRRRHVRVRHGRWVTIKRPPRYAWVLKRVLVRPGRYRVVRVKGKLGWISRRAIVAPVPMHGRGCR